MNVGKDGLIIKEDIGNDVLSKRVGIVTFYSNYNYGTVLQVYALTSFINSLGYHSVIINHCDLKKAYNVKMRIATYKNRLLSCLFHPRLFCKTLVAKKYATQSTVERTDVIKNIFESFIRENLNIIDEDYIQGAKDKFGAFVCGSDQVWKLSMPGLHELFFLRFAPKFKRIAYAPSFGSDMIPCFNKKRLRRYLRDFAYISVREDTGVNIVKESINKEVPHVLDPVLLAGSAFWEEKIKSLPTREKCYLLCYFLSDSSNAINCIKELAERYNLEIVWVDSGQTCSGINSKIVSASPFEFVSLIKQAKIVCTDSFHGTAFSVLLQVPFYVFQRNYEVFPEQSTRVESLLRLTNLEGRLIKGEHVGLDDVMNIDYKKVDNLLEKARFMSEEYLKVALERTVELSKKC